MKKQLLIISLLLLHTVHLTAVTDSSAIRLKKKAFEALKSKKPDLARSYFLQLVQENPHNAELKGMCYNNLGTIDFQEGFNSRGLDFFQKAIDTYETAQKDTLLAKSLYNTGRSYQLLAQYEKAAELLIRALKIFEKNEMKADLSKTYNILGSLYKESSNLELALRYNNLAYETALNIQDSILMSKYLNNRGSTYLEMEFYEKALKDFKSALLIKQKIGLKSSSAYTYYNLGETEFLRRNQQKALHFFTIALSIHKQFNNKREVAYCYNYLGRTYAIQKQWHKAIDFLQKAQELASELDIHELLLYNYQYQYELYELKGDNEQALKYYKLYTDQHEQLLNLNKQKAINELQIKYDVEKKEQENKLLSQKAEIDQLKIKQQETSLKLWKLFTVTVIIFILFVLFLGYKYYRLFEKEKKLANKEKHFNREQHHRIKNHLQILAGLLSFQQKKIENSAAKEVIQESSNRVEVIKMLHLHFYQSGDFNSHTIQLHSYLQEIIENLIILFDKKDIQVEKNIETVLLSPDKALPLGLIFNEIISNALKYGLNQGARSILSISLEQKEKKVILLIKDNGIGNITHQNSTSIGFDLIDQLAKQIDAKIDRNFSNGTVYKITFFT